MSQNRIETIDPSNNNVISIVNNENQAEEEAMEYIREHIIATENIYSAIQENKYYLMLIDAVLSRNKRYHRLLVPKSVIGSLLA
jgi:hypothetical protein